MAQTPFAGTGRGCGGEACKGDHAEREEPRAPVANDLALGGRKHAVDGSGDGLRRSGDDTPR